MLLSKQCRLAIKKVITMKNFRFIFLSILFLIIGGGIGGGGTYYYLTSHKNTHVSNPISTVRIGSFFTAIDYAPYLIARNKKWFEEALKPHNAKVEYTTFQSLPPINESFATDRIDVVFEAEPPAIIGRAAGIDVRITGISCSLVQEVLVPNNSLAKSILDLKNKKIAVLAGTSSHYGLFKILNTAGLKNSDITVIDMLPPDAKSAFETNNVDGWAVWPPFVEQEIINGKGRVLPSSDAQIHSIMAVNGKFADKQPEIAKAVLKTLERSKEWIQANPQEAQQIVAKELNLDLSVVQMAWPKHNWNAQLTNAVIEDIQGKATFLKEMGFIKNNIDVKKDLIRTNQTSQAETTKLFVTSNLVFNYGYS